MRHGAANLRRPRTRGRAPIDEVARAELGLAPADVVFVCVARFAPQKAHDVLLRAFAAARRRAPAETRLRMLLVGDDPFGDGRSRAERLARELELGGGVVFAGIRRDVPALLAASDWAFDRPTAEQDTLSLLVVHRGQIVHERYAPGVDRDTRTRTWSTNSFRHCWKTAIPGPTR